MGRRSRRGIFWSVFQKNSASEKRAVRTRSCPALPVRVAVDVKYCNELAVDFSFSRLYCKVLLVVSHYSGQDFAGQFQKPFVERASKCPGPFGRAHNPVLELLVLDHMEAR